MRGDLVWSAVPGAATWAHRRRRDDPVLTPPPRAPSRPAQPVGSAPARRPANPCAALRPPRCAAPLARARGAGPSSWRTRPGSANGCQDSRSSERRWSAAQRTGSRRARASRGLPTRSCAESSFWRTRIRRVHPTARLGAHRLDRSRNQALRISNTPHPCGRAAASYWPASIWRWRTAVIASMYASISWVLLSPSVIRAR